MIHKNAHTSKDNKIRMKMKTCIDTFSVLDCMCVSFPSLSIPTTL